MYIVFLNIKGKYLRKRVTKGENNINSKFPWAPWGGFCSPSAWSFAELFAAPQWAAGECCPWHSSSALHSPSILRDTAALHCSAFQGEKEPHSNNVERKKGQGSQFCLTLASCSIMQPFLPCPGSFPARAFSARNGWKPLLGQGQGQLHEQVICGIAQGPVLRRAHTCFMLPYCHL